MTIYKKQSCKNRSSKKGQGVRKLAEGLHTHLEIPEKTRPVENERKDASKSGKGSEKKNGQ